MLLKKKEPQIVMINGEKHEIIKEGVYLRAKKVEPEKEISIRILIDGEDYEEKKRKFEAETWASLPKDFSPDEYTVIAPKDLLGAKIGIEEMTYLVQIREAFKEQFLGCAFGMFLPPHADTDNCLKVLFLKHHWLTELKKLVGDRKFYIRRASDYTEVPDYVIVIRIIFLKERQL